MSTTTATRLIDAPPEAVFDTVAHIEEYSKAVPDILRTEILSETKRGVGTRFKETRRMGRREATTELEVTEYEPHERVRIVSDAGGTIWDTVFTTKAAAGGKTDLHFRMDAKAYKLAAKIFNPLIKGMIRKFIVEDMDAVKAYCEGGAGEGASPEG